MTDGGKSTVQKMVQRSTGRDLAELLRELYVDKRHTDEEIAEALGVNRMTIVEWRKAFGISRADRAPVTL